MKYVRLNEKNKVVEILPESTYEKGIEFWYGAEFAEQCIEAPDDVAQDMYYVDGEFSAINPNADYEYAVKQIQILKNQLTETDYKAIKYSEGLISEQDYAEVKAERQSWRDEINQLEQEIANKEDNNDESEN